MKKSLFHTLLIALAAIFAAGCNTPTPTNVGTRADALDDNAWKQSEWISAADAQVVTGTIRDGSRAADGASWFVSTVTNDKKVASAKWMTCGLGVYDLYVNGKLVGEEVLKPGFTHSAKTKRSFTYDITDAICKKAGKENVFAAQVTPGWWADKIVTPGGHQGMIGKKCAFRGVLELTFADGTKQLLGTDTEHWLAGIAGPVKHAAIFDGEDYDARELPGYDCLDKLSTPEVNTEFNGEILPSNGAEVYMRTDLALAPVKAYVWKGVSGNTDEEYGTINILREYAPGSEMTLSPEETLVIDFGQNCAGVPSFVFKAKEGTTLNCLPAELLNDGNGAKSRGMDGPEGSCHRTNLRIPQTGMILNYTFADAKDFVSFLPRNTFFGYRFVSITASDEVTFQSIQSIPITSIAQNLETGTITTGSDDINKLISNTIWGQRSNYLSVPTDCPQRNERLGWTADTQVFTETGSFFANTSPFFHKWMRDMMDSQSELGGFPGVAPTSQYGAEMMRLGWADAGVIVPWTIWKQFDDKQIVNETWESMEKYINWVNDTKFNHQAHISENGNYQWADWLSYEPLESCSGRSHGNDKDGRWNPLPETVEYWNYLSASYWAIDAGMMRDMAAATGRDAAKYERMEKEAKAFIKETFLNEDGTFKTEILNTMQTPALFALKNGVVEGEAKDAMLARLRQNFAEHDGCLQTGFLGTSILMATLTDNGMSDIAWDLLFQRKNPSWLYSIDNGATTIWERWNSYTIEKGMGPAGMNSFNHYAYGSVCQWIWETVAGISADVKAPGFKHIIMRPLPDKRLGWVKAEFKSAAGLIKSEWKYEGDTWTWTFTVPEGATASVTLPGETETKEYNPGTYTLTK
ncbi:MAG: family 78 glycoside hydrolase catalytic domain [Bacteroidaceae bacterium]|nr:family 78 glycoside hydrolase catalytic domain [Bacteroidaceae bacterium]